MNYETVRKNYLSGLWGLPMLKMAYQRGVITKEEYKTIKAEKEAMENEE